MPGKLNRGFTLIEILVVVLIIGITISFACLSFGDFGAGRRAVVNAEQFSSYLKFLQHQAILENNALGVSINKEGYTTYRFNQQTWQIISKQSIFHERYFPSSIVVNIRTSHRNKPEIIINAEGDISEFFAHFGTLQNPTIATLSSKEGGELTIKRS